jgi:hypothetical protein
MQSDLKARIHRLFEDEALTSDIDDAPARALLEWAAEQLREGREEGAVRRLVRTMAQLVRDRSELDPEQLQQRLEKPAPSPWSAEKQTLMTTLIAQREQLPAKAWAEGLVRLVSTALPTAAGQTQQASTSNGTTPRPPTQPGAEARPEGGPPAPARRSWWQRIIPRRRRP